MQKFIFLIISLFCFNNSMIYSCYGEKSIKERDAKNFYQNLKNQGTLNFFQKFEVHERIDLINKANNEYLELFEKFHAINRSLLIKEFNQDRQMFKKYFWIIMNHFNLANQVALRRESIQQNFQDKAWILHGQQNRAAEQARFDEMEENYNPDSQPVSPRNIPKVHFSLTPCSSRHPSPCPTQQVTPCTSKQGTPSKIPLSDITNRSNVASVSVSDWEN